MLCGKTVAGIQMILLNICQNVFERRFSRTNGVRSHDFKPQNSDNR